MHLGERSPKHQGVLLEKKEDRKDASGFNYPESTAHRRHIKEQRIDVIDKTMK